MLAYNLKDILGIVPELQEHIKKANIEEEYPLDNKDGCIASYMRCYYLSKVAEKVVDPEIIERLEKAARLYDIKETVIPFIQKMKKFAEQKQRDTLNSAETLTVKQAEALFEGNLTGFFDIEETAKQAKNIMVKYASDVTSPEVKRYTGQAYFNKKAAVDALEARAEASGKEVYTKFASAITKTMEYDSSPIDIMAVCERVTALDKQAGLINKGFNFYKEALSVGPERIGDNFDKIGSALTVKVCGKPVAYEKIERLGKHRIAQYLGKDIASEMTADPIANKRIIESLPLDVQRVLASLLRNV